jgi:Predicted Zn-dependent hydrolases of the beta-lactamase fold
MTTLTWHGHAAFMIDSPDCRILIDPFFTCNPSAVTSWQSLKKPDLVLVTHLHADHEGDAVAICRETGAQLGGVVGLVDVLVEKGVPQSQVINGIGFNIGGTVTVGNTRITMTEAFHTTAAGACTGYIISLANGCTLYHAGDTCVFANMETWGSLYSIDVALLPIGGTFTMDGRQAALAAKMLKAKAAVPMHYKTFPVLEQTADSFVSELATAAPQCRPVLLETGDARALPLH